jgi:hypothetical protein
MKPPIMRLEPLGMRATASSTEIVFMFRNLFLLAATRSCVRALFASFRSALHENPLYLVLANSITGSKMAMS